MRIAQLFVEDEVNIKIKGLALDTRKKLKDKFSFFQPHARFSKRYELGRWDGKVGFFTMGGQTYQNLLPEILPILSEDGYDFELTDTRNYQCDFEFETVAEDSLDEYTWPIGHTHEHQKIKLRDYQVEIINNFLENTQSIQKVATGAGKTLVTAVLSLKCQQYGRTIVIVPSKSLVKQTEDEYKNLDLDVGVYFGDRKDYDNTHIICTWQSLNNMIKEDKEIIQHFLRGVTAVIVDEVHQAQANVLKNMLSNAMKKIPIRWGLTGTIPKDPTGSTSILCAIGPVSNNVNAKTLQNKGVLANCHVNILQMLDIAEFKTYQSELKYLLSTPERLDFMADEISKIRNTGNTLVLVDRIQAAHELSNRVEDSVVVKGDTKIDDRKEEYNKIATEDDQVIIATYGVASVGINIPRIFNLVLIEPGKSFVRVIQSIGRGLRKANDKDFVQIWDITSTCKFSKRHLTERKKYYKEAEYPFTITKVDYE